MSKSLIHRCACTAVVLFVVLFLARELWAANVEGTSSGIFTNPIPASAVVSGVGTNNFTWGDPDGFGTGPSSLRFTGSTLTADFDKLFSLGILTFFNGTILGGTGADAVDLKVTIMLTMPSGVTKEFTQTLTLVNTPNTNDPIASADLVLLPTSIPEITFTVNNIEHILKFEGFGSITGAGGATTIDRFFVLEGGTASAELLGRIVVCTAAAGFQDTRKDVPGPDGGKLKYKANISRGVSGNALAVAVTLCNPNPKPVKLVACAMGNAEAAVVQHDKWVADFQGGQWTCTETGTVNSSPSFHFGCRRLAIQPGEEKPFYNDGGVLAGKRLSPYVDFLLDGPVAASCSALTPNGVRGMNQFLVPVAPPSTYVNVWAIYNGIGPLSPTLGCTIDWPVGNWFTMGNPDTYLARLNGAVLDAPTGSMLTFRFPPGSPQLERTFTVPPANPSNPTCLGLPVDVSEPFVIPPDPATMSLHIELPAQCSALREGSVVRFHGEAVGDAGSPVFQPGQFIVEHSGTCVVDNTPPRIEQFTAVPRGDGSLDVRVAATDKVSTPIEALLHFRVNGGPEQQLPMRFDDPPVIGDIVFFHQIISGPFPAGASVEVTADVFDDVANPVMSPPLTVVAPKDIVKIQFAQLYDLSGSPVLFVSATSTAAPRAELAVTVPGCLTNRPMNLEDGQYVFEGLIPECSNIALFAFFQGAEAVVTATSNFGGSASVPMQIYPPFP